MGRETITIVTKMVDLISGTTKKINESIESMAGGVQKSTKVIQTMNQGLVTEQKEITKTTKGLKQFKMEYLGIMFAGMAIYRTFGGLIRKQMELFGVSEMLSASWTVVLLPVMERLSDILYPLLEAFMDLPEGVKLAIGIFVILVAVIGLILFISLIFIP